MKVRKLVVLARIWLACKIDPWPTRGEGWCIGCSLNGGRLRVLPENGIKQHLSLHSEANPEETVSVRWSVHR